MSMIKSVVIEIKFALKLKSQFMPQISFWLGVQQK